MEGTLTKVMYLHLHARLGACTNFKLEPSFASSAPGKCTVHSRCIILRDLRFSMATHSGPSRLYASSRCGLAWVGCVITLFSSCVGRSCNAGPTASGLSRFSHSVLILLPFVGDLIFQDPPPCPCHALQRSVVSSPVVDPCAPRALTSPPLCDARSTSVTPTKRFRTDLPWICQQQAMPRPPFSLSLGGQTDLWNVLAGQPEHLTCLSLACSSRVLPAHTTSCFPCRT